MLHSAKRRMAMALALSLSMHLLLLGGPRIEPPSSPPPLPPLQARLEPLPVRPAATPPRRTRSAVKTATATLSPTAIPPMPPPAAASAPAIVSAASSVTATEEAEPTRPPLPKHAWLRFDVSLGDEAFKIGEAIHTLDIADGRYELRAEIRSTGLTALLTEYRLSQHSRGSTDGVHLIPEQFSEEALEFGELKKFGVHLDRAHGVARFSNGKERPLPAEVQDFLSILYQFPGEALNTEIIKVTLASAHDLEEYDFEVSALTEIDTPLGKVHTLYLNKMHENGTPGLGIWFAREYRWLPVKVRHIGSQGNTSAVAVITDIRVSEE